MCFLAISKISVFQTFVQSFEHLQKSIKIDVSDTNGHQKRAFRVENMLIHPGQHDFRRTVAHFMRKLFFVKLSTDAFRKSTVDNRKNPLPGGLLPPRVGIFSLFTVAHITNM